MINCSSGNSFNVAKFILKGGYYEEGSYFFGIYSNPPDWSRG